MSNEKRLQNIRLRCLEIAAAQMPPHSANGGPARDGSALQEQADALLEYVLNGRTGVRVTIQGAGGARLGESGGNAA